MSGRVVAVATSVLAFEAGDMLWKLLQRILVLGVLAGSVLALLAMFRGVEP